MTSFQAETHLVFPKSASVEQLKRIRESIATERDHRLHGGQPFTNTAQASVDAAPAVSSQPVTPDSPQALSVVKMCFSLV